MINVFQPALGDEEVEAVRQVFVSNWVGKGRITQQFEQAFADFVGVSPQQVRSINSCTEGLFQAMALLDIGRGDEVILPSLSFVGAANAIAASGARPIFCDVNPHTLNVTAEHIEACLSPRTRAVLLLHYGGAPCEMAPVGALVEAKGIALIEDSACSVASTWHGHACGTLGDIGVWSFDAMKILVTGDGGMVYCRDPQRMARLEQLTYLGLEQSSGFAQAGQGSRSGWWAFDVSEFGRRSIMNDMASAIGLEQIKKLPAFIERRRQVCAFYDVALRDLGWLRTPPDLPADAESSHYFYWVQSGDRDRLAVHLRDRGIYTTFRYYPLHRVRAYGSSAHLPNADLAAETTLCLPLHQSLSDDDLARVASAIAEFPYQV